MQIHVSFFFLKRVLSTVIRGLYSALQPSEEWGITKEYIGNVSRFNIYLLIYFLINFVVTKMVERLVKHVTDSLACFAVDEDLFIAGM